MVELCFDVVYKVLVCDVSQLSISEIGLERLEDLLWFIDEVENVSDILAFGCAVLARQSLHCGNTRKFFIDIHRD
jgi:hypothetical protein